MKLLVALLLLAGSAAARSVDPCTGQTTEAPVWTPPDLTKDVVCERATGADYGYGEAGVALWQYCWDAAKGKFYPMTGVATWGYIQKNPGLVGEVLKNWPKADGATIKRILVTYDSPGSFIDPESAAIWCPLRNRIIAGIPAPVPPSWITFGVSSTPMYRFNGTALTASAGSVASGLSCDCTKPFALGASTYCPLKNGPATTVARCTRV